MKMYGFQKYVPWKTTLRMQKTIYSSIGITLYVTSFKAAKLIANYFKTTEFCLPACQQETS